MNDFTIEDIKKLVEESLQELPTNNVWLDSRYDEQIKLVGHTQPYYRLFYRIAEFLKPDFSLELGSWQGTASAHLAGGYPKGQVATIDIHREDKEAQKRCYEAQTILPNYTYINKWSWDAGDDIKAFKKSIDILYIDAWHDYQYVTRERDLYFPLLSNPALVICDDITTAHNFDGMIKFWEEIPDPKFLDSRIHPGIPMGFCRYVR